MKTKQKAPRSSGSVYLNEATGTAVHLILVQDLLGQGSDGEIFVNGHNLSMLSRREIQEYRRGIGFVQRAS